MVSISVDCVASRLLLLAVSLTSSPAFAAEAYEAMPLTLDGSDGATDDAPSPQPDPDARQPDSEEYGSLFFGLSVSHPQVSHVPTPLGFGITLNSIAAPGGFAAANVGFELGYISFNGAYYDIHLGFGPSYRMGALRLFGIFGASVGGAGLGNDQGETHLFKAVSAPGLFSAGRIQFVWKRLALEVFSTRTWMFARVPDSLYGTMLKFGPFGIDIHLRTYGAISIVGFSFGMRGPSEDPNQ